MKLRNLLIINAVVALIYGLSYELVPATVLSLYGTTQGSSEVFYARLFGAALIGIGLLTWLARNIMDSGTQRAVILSLLAFSIIGAIVAVSATVSGVMSAFGWTGVAVFSFFALGYAYFQFIKPSAT